MSYAITTKEIEPQPVLTARRRVPMPEIATTIDQVLGKVVDHAEAEDITISGRPFVRYQDVSGGMMTIEPGLPVVLPEGAAEPSGPGAVDPDSEEVRMDVLEGGLVATTMHTGPYDGLREAYQALEGWMKAEGFAPRDAPWELYLTGPGEHPDPKRWKTEVYWPVRRAR